MVDEQTVVTILEAMAEAQYCKGSSLDSLAELNTKLNKFVGEMAVRQPELVDINFLARYLSLCTRFRSQNFKVTLNDDLKQVISKKLIDSDSQKNLKGSASTDLIKVAHYYSN